jgi:hypothetical protein
VGQSGIARTNPGGLQSPVVKLGTAGISLGAGLLFEYNDNVDLADSGLSGDAGPQEDLFVTPQVLINAVIPFTQLNVLTIGITAGYEFSLNGTRDGNSRIAVTPGSQIAFRVLLGDVTLDFYDRFGVENNPVGTTGVGSTSNYTLFTNTSGVQAAWDVNDLDITAGYNFTLSRTLGSSDSLDENRNTHGLFSRAALSFLGIWSAGLESSALYSTSSGENFGDQTSLSIGPFVDVQLTPHTHILASVGVQWFKSNGADLRFTSNVTDSLRDGSFPETERTGSDSNSNDTGMYWSIGIQNRFNTFYTHSLFAGQERQVGIGVDYADVAYVRYSASWLLFPKLSLQLSSGLEFVKQTFAGFAENARVWTTGFGFEYRLTPHLRTQTQYQFASRSSDQEYRDYRQNVITLGFTYDF